MTKNTRPLKIVHLYPDALNIYGDNGNVQALMLRAKLRRIPVELTEVNPGDQLPKDIDVLISGGGQDKSQMQVQPDLLQKAPLIRQLVDKGVAMLLICGAYQLSGRTFCDSSGKQRDGAGIFKMVTKPGKGQARISGNIVIDSPQFGRLFGYENHGGRTFLNPGVEEFATVILGHGNNDANGHKDEGARVNNCFGTYLHGPIVPKSPKLADGLLEIAMKNRGDTLPEGGKRLAEIDSASLALNEYLTKNWL